MALTEKNNLTTSSCKMKILYIIPYVPYPLNSGGNQAFFNMVDAVRKEHQVSILLYIHISKQQRNLEMLQKVWPDVTFYCYTPHEQNLNMQQNTTADSFASMPKWTQQQCRFFDYLQHSMERKIERRKRKYEQQEDWLKNFSLGAFVRENSVLFAENADLNDGFLEYVQQISRKDFDLIQTEFYEYLPLIYVLPHDVETVFVHHELRYVRNANEMQLFDQQRPTDKLLLDQQKDAELSMLSHYKHVIVLTETDKTLLSEAIPSERIYVSPALTSAGTAKDHKPFRPSRDLVFVGGGDHFPNADGMLWFCKEVFPELKKLGTPPNIYIVGKWGNTIQGIIKYICPSVQFTGFVDDLDEFLNGKISIVPIRIGSGMRMKILDTISAAAPLVTTSKGCEGLPFTNHVDCLIADTAAEFANSIHSLMEDTATQEQMVKAASHKLESLLDGRTLIEKRMAFYTEIENEISRKKK